MINFLFYYGQSLPNTLGMVVLDWQNDILMWGFSASYNSIKL